MMLNPDLTILVVDDSLAHRKLIVKMIKKLGNSKILEAANGQEALDIIDSEGKTIDLVLTDWVMPVMEGPQLVQKIREKKEFTDLKIVLITAEIRRAKRAQAQEIGVNAIITKPISGRAFSDMVAKLF